MKKIIHVDMDCFYAQVEMRDNPSLKNLPVAVGGAPKTRSVLCTSNYEARKFGVKAAMPTDLAIKKCPHLIVIPPNFNKYQQASELIHHVFAKYTDLIEPLSLDEAYLDVSHESHATLLLKKIKEDILRETDLTSSIGLAPNKFLAKIASDWKKPDGLFVIRPEHVHSFVDQLDVKLIPGVGQKSLQVLHSLNIKTLKDIKSTSPHVLNEYFGKYGHDLINYAHGIDEREVITEWERKTLSVETTFLKDYFWGEELKTHFADVLLELGLRLDEYLTNNPDRKIKKILAKTRFSDFSRTSAETIIRVKNDEKFNINEYQDQLLYLLRNNLDKKTLPVRLIGLGVRFYCDNEINNNEWQLPLFEHEYN